MPSKCRRGGAGQDVLEQSEIILKWVLTPCPFIDGHPHTGEAENPVASQYIRLTAVGVPLLPEGLGDLWKVTVLHSTLESQRNWAILMAAKDGSRGRGSNRVDELTSTTGRQAGKEQERNPLLSKFLIS